MPELSQLVEIFHLRHFEFINMFRFYLCAPYRADHMGDIAHLQGRKDLCKYALRIQKKYMIPFLSPDSSEIYHAINSSRRLYHRAIKLHGIDSAEAKELNLKIKKAEETIIETEARLSNTCKKTQLTKKQVIAVESSLRKELEALASKCGHLSDSGTGKILKYLLSIPKEIKGPKISFLEGRIHMGHEIYYICIGNKRSLRVKRSNRLRTMNAEENNVPQLATLFNYEFMLDKRQKDFYDLFVSCFEQGEPLDVKGQIGYISCYLIENIQRMNPCQFYELARKVDAFYSTYYPDRSSLWYSWALSF